jgi:Periplasmic protein involved in polysaccharide export
MRKLIGFLLLFLSGTLLFAQESGLKKDFNSASPAFGISVTIGGSFIVNGSFASSPLERVDQFVTRIFNQAKAQTLSNSTGTNSNYLDQTIMKLDNYAKRDIKLKRFTGEEIVIDLEKFRLTGDFKYNPFLKNDDILIFPKVDLERNFISIDGAVNNSVKFQYVEGDKLQDALLIAQGVSVAYQNVKQAEISRLNYSGEKEELIKVDLNSDFTLQPGDRIKVLADETNRKDYRVLVLGEVERPGYIAIAKDNETLKSVLAKAGGFKANADIENAELIRANDNYSFYKKEMLTKSFEQNRITNERMEGSLWENQMVEDLLMLRMSYLKEEDSLYFKIDNQLRTLRGNALIDFSKLDSDTSVAANFIVKDGDVILIPQKKELVYIFGQVATAGYVKYKEGADIQYYIEQAGGLGELARKVEEISVIKSKSRSWTTVDGKQIKIEPGDYIWVPKKTPRTFEYYFDYYMKRVGEFASVIGTIITIILLTRK